MTQTILAFLVTAVALVGGIAFLTVRTLRLPVAAPDRLVSELRLAQVAALVLALIAGASLGLVVGQADRAGTTIEIALGFAFFVVATVAPFRDPREALTILAAAFAAHAVADVLHRPPFLTDGIAPQWYIVGGALVDVGLGALCYLPLLRR